jgi:hypothetical protein
MSSQVKVDACEFGPENFKCGARPAYFSLQIPPLFSPPTEKGGFPMARHWRKPYRSASQFNSFLVWLVGGSLALAALVLLSRHIYI